MGRLSSVDVDHGVVVVVLARCEAGGGERLGWGFSLFSFSLLFFSSIFWQMRGRFAPKFSLSCSSAPPPTCLATMLLIIVPQAQA
jgi:hypothetical protein